MPGCSSAMRRSVGRRVPVASRIICLRTAGESAGQASYSPRTRAPDEMRMSRNGQSRHSMGRNSRGRVQPESGLRAGQLAQKLSGACSGKCNEKVMEPSERDRSGKPRKRKRSASSGVRMGVSQAEERRKLQQRRHVAHRSALIRWVSMRGRGEQRTFRG